MLEHRIARKLDINGIVQGVGFRPFVFQSANRHGLCGEIANTASGVSISVEGEPEQIASFCRDLEYNHPPLAEIMEFRSEPGPVTGVKNFSIALSRSESLRSTLISPDVSICGDCLRELFDPKDRRYQYPFINCTNCGPRYTIIADIPYDRCSTSMSGFPLCERCRNEYIDPNDRRFHAQPNACPACGPRISLYGRDGAPHPATDPVQEAAVLLREGCIVCVKGLGGFHLAVDAGNDEAVARLRERKRREEKPFAVMSFDIDRIRTYAYIDAPEEALLASIQRPIVLLKKREPNGLSKAVSPRNKYFGVMLPYTPLHYLLLQYDFTALVMTSGNPSDEPIAVENGEALKRLADVADYFLMHNRDIYLRCDDSIVQRSDGQARLIRRSRGYVPAPVVLKNPVPPVLACGAELKNTVCLTKGRNAFLSQHIGDLKVLPAYAFFKSVIAHMERILDIEPQIVAYDLHPEYLSSRYAQSLPDIRKVAVQHHHAHIAACMAEHMLEGPVIGLAFDGTGYGTDGKIWGGEILTAGYDGFDRAAHLSYTAMPGGASAVKEPWRMAVAYLLDAFGDGMWNLDLPLFDEMAGPNIRTLTGMISKRVNSPETSSLGRLFDGVSAILGIRTVCAFEGQAAIELEMIGRMDSRASYDYEWEPGSPCRIQVRPIITGIVKDMENGVSPGEISGKFHNTLVGVFSRICGIIRSESGLNRVVLSGGVFQNSRLLTALSGALRKQGFKVYSHSRVPVNDGGIALGQAVVAAALARR